MKYHILVNGRRRYKQAFTLRKAKAKAQWLRLKGYALVEIVEARDE